MTYDTRQSLHNVKVTKLQIIKSYRDVALKQSKGIYNLMQGQADLKLFPGWKANRVLHACTFLSPLTQTAPPNKEMKEIYQPQ